MQLCVVNLHCLAAPKARVMAPIKMLVTELFTVRTALTVAFEHELLLISCKLFIIIFPEIIVYFSCAVQAYWTKWRSGWRRTQTVMAPQYVYCVPKIIGAEY